MKKECNVVMLAGKSADQKSQIILNKQFNILGLGYGNNLDNIQHLYLISDGEIKEGDWYIDDTNSIRQSVTSDKDYWFVRPDYKKVIVTTDSSLWEHDDTVPYPKTRPALPQFSEDFIKAYVKAYNEGNPIEEVLVEYDLQNYRSEYSFDSSEYKLKLRDDNTVIISEAKTTCSREEVCV